MAYTRLQVTDHVDKWDAAKITHLEDGIVGSVHTTTQSLTEAQKETARNNIGVGDQIDDILFSSLGPQFVKNIYPTIFSWDGHLNDGKERIVADFDDGYCMEYIKVSHVPINFNLGSDYLVEFSGLVGLSDDVQLLNCKYTPVSNQIHALIPTASNWSFGFVFISILEDTLIENIKVSRGLYALHLYEGMTVGIAKSIISMPTQLSQSIVSWDNIDFTTTPKTYDCNYNEIIFNGQAIGFQSWEFNSNIVKLHLIDTNPHKWLSFTNQMNKAEIKDYNGNSYTITNLTVLPNSVGAQLTIGTNFLMMILSTYYITDEKCFIPGVYISEEIQSIKFSEFFEIESLLTSKISHKNYDCPAYTEKGYRKYIVEPVTKTFSYTSGDFNFWGTAFPVVQHLINPTTKKYKLLFNGVEYDLIKEDRAEVDFQYGLNINYPIVSAKNVASILSQSPNSMIMVDLNFATTLGWDQSQTYDIEVAIIEYQDEIIHKLDKKYLPDDIGNGLPEVTEEDNGKVLQVINGKWQLTNISASGYETWEGGSY